MRTMRERYGLLRVMAVVFKVVAWVSIAVAVFVNTMLAVGLGILVTPQAGAIFGFFAGFSAWILMAAYALVLFGTLYALSEAIYLLFDIRAEVRSTEEKVRHNRPAA